MKLLRDSVTGTCCLGCPLCDLGVISLGTDGTDAYVSFLDVPFMERGKYRIGLGTFVKIWFLYVTPVL